MFMSQDLLDKINIYKFKKYLFCFNFILSSNLLLRLSYVKKENDIRFINLLYGLEFWSSNRVFIKKVGFFYKIKNLIIEIFFKAPLDDCKNWIFYWKFFLIPSSTILLMEKCYKITLYNTLVTLDMRSLNKLQARFRFLKNKNLNFIFLFKSFNSPVATNIYISLLINLIKMYKLYDDYLIWSIYL
jgi:hypothetical protein